MNLMMLLGIMYFLLSIIYFISAITTNIRTDRPTRPALGLFIAEAIIVPILLLFCSIVIVLNGWRLDPLLQFQQLTLFAIVTYLIAKDFVSK